MQELDWSIGEMMTALSDRGIAENTIVIFTSDERISVEKTSSPKPGPFRLRCRLYGRNLQDGKC